MPPHPYRLAIFDYDGTLADSFSWFLSVFDEVADEFNYRRLDRARIDEFRRLGAADMMTQHGIPLWRVPLIATRMRKLAARDRDAIRLFPGAAEMLKVLAARGVALALVTSNTDANVRATLGPELMGVFACCECGASIFGKRTKLRRVLKRCGVAAQDAIAIGDEVRDIDAADAERIAFGAVSWGYTDVTALEARTPAHVFSRFNDVVVLFSEDGSPDQVRR